jgi:hypothetical protein
MAISYTGQVTVTPQQLPDVITEILFENKTIKESLVSFETGIKAGTLFTENTNTVTMQAWSVNPTGSESGTIGLLDTYVTPVKCEYIDKFSNEDLRSARFNRSMKPGAWNIVSDEFGQVVLNGGVAATIAADTESKFWNGATSATKTAVAALTAGTGNTAVGAAEKTLVAAMPTTLFDSVITRAIYNSAAVGGRIKVAGTTITSTNIGDEYAKLYAAIPAATLSAAAEKPYIYAPRSHKQLINIYNISQTYRDKFSVDMIGDKYFYLGVEIKFVPLAENVILAALPSNIKWCTDLESDFNMLIIDKYPAPRKDYFYDVVFTIFAHVVNQKFNALYVG